MGLQLKYLQDFAPAQLMTNTSTLTSLDSQLIHHQDPTPAQVMMDASMRMLETYMLNSLTLFILYLLQLRSPRVAMPQ
jgi:hypothetical protein